jgi:hypothetical protein
MKIMKLTFFLIFTVLICLVGVKINVSAQVVGGTSSRGSGVAAGLESLVDISIFKKIPKAGAKPKSTTTTSRSTNSSGSVAKNSKISNSKSGAKASVTPNIYAPGVLTFIPTGNSGIDRELARTLSNDSNEQAAFVEIFKATKAGYDSETASLGRKNDVAMALTFFVSTCLTVYHDTPEPSEDAVESVYQLFANSMKADAAIGNMSNSEKQAVNDRLIYISGLILAGYVKGKQDNDQSILQAYRLLAGGCFKSLTAIDPNSIRFGKSGLELK